MLRRRRLLGLVVAGGATSLSGCSAFGNSDDASDNTHTTSTVVFNNTSTNTPTLTNTDTQTSTRNEERTFTGGSLADFRTALNTASGLPNATLQIQPGTYRFNPLQEVEPGEIDPHLQMLDVEGVHIEGNGAKFIFTEPLRPAILFRGGQDLTIQNLSIDYDPVPFTQGEIVELEDDRRQITLALDDGYPLLDDRMFDNAERVWASVHQPDGSFVEGIKKKDSFDKFFASIDRIDGRRYRLILRDSISPNGLAVGNRLTVVARNSNYTIGFYQTKNPTVENVTVHAAGGSVFVANVCSDPVFRGVTIAPPSDSDRQVASDADGIRLTNCLSSAKIEGCRHEYLLDDSIVLQHTFTTVTEILDDKTIAVEAWHPFVIGPNDTLEALSESGSQLGTLPPIDDYEPRFSTPLYREKPATITFIDPITDTLSSGDYIGNQETGSQNFTVQNNELRAHRGKLVRIAARNGTVRENILEGSAMNPIELECDNDGNFSPQGYVTNVSVENNTIRRAGMMYFASHHPAGIRTHLLTNRDVPDEGTPNRNIQIRNNDIETSAGVGIEIENAVDVEVVNNRIVNVNQLGYEPYGFSIVKSHNVTISENTVEGTSEHLQYFGQRNESRNITKSDNTLRIDDETQRPAIQQWLPLTLDFNRVVQPGPNSRYLTARAYRLRLHDGDTTRREYNIGVDESGLRLDRGYFSPESGEVGTFRWLGGEAGITRLLLPAAVIEQADRLSMKSMPIEEGIEATVSVDGTDGGRISFDSEQFQWYTAELPE